MILAAAAGMSSDPQQEAAAQVRAEVEAQAHSAPYIRGLQAISTSAAATYGHPDARSTIRIGNGGLGPTGLLQALCQAWLDTYQLGSAVKFEWVCNHSAHTLLALQAGVVDIGFTYERADEERGEVEGWLHSVGVLCHDHFVLIGPAEDPARAAAAPNLAEALRRIASLGSLFHSRGDGSATVNKERWLWTTAGISPAQLQSAGWYKTVAGTPLQAIEHADTERAYFLSDRATILTARHRGGASNLAVLWEGGTALMNTCVTVIRVGERRTDVVSFVSWLEGREAQGIIRDYGTEWDARTPLVTPRDQMDVLPRDLLKEGLKPRMKSLLVNGQ